MPRANESPAQRSARLDAFERDAMPVRLTSAPHKPTPHHKPIMFITHNITAVEGKISLALEAIDLAEHFGGNWGEHPQHAVGDWAEAIASEDTRLGYWEWVANRIDSGDFDLDDLDN